MNKDQQTKEYLEKLNNIKLSETSRERIGNNLLEYARFHSVKNDVRVESMNRSIEQVPQSTSLLNRFLNLKHMTAALLIALMIGGGTSYAAQNSMPGDALYPVKIEINENVQSAFAFSDEAEARLQAHLVEKRLAEARELASKGKLTAKASTDLSSRIQAHYEEVVKNNSEVESGGNYQASAEVRSSLEGSFRSYVAVLTDLNSNVSGNNGGSLIAQINGYAKTTADDQIAATTSVSATNKSQISATLANTEKGIKVAKQELSDKKSKISTEVHARLEAKLAEATEAQAEAQASFRAEAYQAAYASTHTAMRMVAEVRSSLNSMLNLNGKASINAEAIINGLFGNKSDVDTESSGNSTSTSTTSPESTDALDTNLILNGNAGINSTLDGSVDDTVNSNVNGNINVNGSGSVNTNQSGGSVQGNTNVGGSVGSGVGL